MKRFCKFFLTALLIFTAAAQPCSAVEYSHNSILITPYESGRVKVERKAKSGSVNLSFYPSENISGFDKITFYLDISSYASSRPAYNGVILPFRFTVASNGVNYYFKGSANEIPGYSDNSPSDTLTFAPSGAYSYNFRGYITLSASAFFSARGEAFPRYSKADCFKLSADPTAMSDFYFLLGDIYAEKKGQKYKISDFEQFPDFEYQSSSAPELKTSYITTRSADLPVTDGFTELQTGENIYIFENPAKETAQPESQPGTKFKGSGKSYIVKTTEPAIKPAEDSKGQEKLKSGISQTDIKGTNRKNNILPLACSALFSVLIVTAMIILRRDSKIKSKNIKERETENEIKDNTDGE